MGVPFLLFDSLGLTLDLLRSSNHILLGCSSIGRAPHSGCGCSGFDSLHPSQKRGTAMKLIIAGSRGFRDYDRLEKETLQFLKKHKHRGEEVEIISGRARGADRLGERFANRFGLRIIQMPADWTKHGRAAGMIRNRAMADAATHALLFWNGVSPGTQGMKKLSEKTLVTEIIYI